MTQDKHLTTPLHALLLLFFGALFTYVYLGFYSPDPQYLRGSLPLLLVAVRFIFPAVALVLLVLCWACLTKRVALLNVVIICMASLAAFLLIYPPGSYWYYKRSFQHNTGSFHTYLQLTPPRFAAPDADTDEVVRIFCLGGSSTAWPDSQGVDWPSRVEKILQKKYPEKTIEVHNLAKEWYTSLHTLINYSTNLQQYEPDILVITHAINDLLHNADFSYFSGGEFRADYGHFYGPISGLIHRRTLPDTLLNLLRSYWYFSPREVIQTESFPGLTAFQSNLSTIATLARSQNAKVLLLSQPNLYKDDISEQEKASLYMLNVEAVGPTKRWDYSTALSGMKQYTNASKIVAEDQKLYFADLESMIPKTQQYFSDDVHYKDDAFPLIAASVARELSRVIDSSK